MAEPTLTFKCLGHTKRDDGTIERYTIEVTNTRSDQVEVLQVEPGHLASAQSMKRLLLNRCMFYTAKQKQHAQMLVEMFDRQCELAVGASPA
ncbi:hypothetical protein D3C77_533800 [compost metagenome]